MIIGKLALTQEEREEIANSEAFEVDFATYHQRAKHRYILSFGEKLGYTVEFWGKYPPHEKMKDVPEKDKKSIKKAILSDVKEILQAVTKSDFESGIEVGAFDCEPNFVNAVRFLLCDVVDIQISACDYYRLGNLEILKLAEKKAAEWYEMPQPYISEWYKTPPDSKDSKKKETDSGELEELPIIQRVKKPESVCYALFKPTYTLFNNFPIGQTKKLNAASEADRRKGKTANILLLLNFDELEGVKISRTLTIYDKSVWNACANLARCGYEIVTAQDVYRFMGYNNNLNQRDKKKILESIETIIRARVFINNKEEHALYKKYDEISLNTPLLAAEICKAKIGNTVVEEAIRIIEPPKLFAIAEKRGQITTIPFAVLESPINKNDDIALITDYLLIRISRMKNSKQIHRTILLDTLYDKCNITDSASDRMKKSRLPDKINRLLNHYKSVGWIGGYKLTTKEIVIIPEKPEEE